MSDARVGGRQLPELSQLPTGDTPVWPTRGMEGPHCFVIFDHYIRVWWRSPIELTRADGRRIIRVLEHTDLDSHFTTGLHWSYSAHVPDCWYGYAAYVLNGHFPGMRPMKTLRDVELNTRREVYYSLLKLQSREAFRAHQQLKNGRVQSPGIAVAPHTTTPMDSADPSSGRTEA